jgi:hypothetical protein
VDRTSLLLPANLPALVACQQQSYEVVVAPRCPDCRRWM